MVVAGGVENPYPVPPENTVYVIFWKSVVIAYDALLLTVVVAVMLTPDVPGHATVTVAGDAVSGELITGAASEVIV